LACGEKCNAFFILAGSLADPELFICNEYIYWISCSLPCTPINTRNQYGPHALSCCKIVTFRIAAIDNLCTAFYVKDDILYQGFINEVPPVSSSTPPQAAARPLSPHLMIYRKQLTSMLSISHRMTGVFLSAGTLALVALVWALASGPDEFALLTGLLKTTIGLVALVGWSFCFYFHLCSGIRHLFWDAGCGLDLKTVYLTGYGVIAAAVALTLLTWGFVIYG
jgi:succinate dehydrogenase / fumarate reductase cytochrome b subunit